MTVTVDTDGTVVRPRGELDLVAAPVLRAAVEQTGATSVVIDLAEVEFMNSSGLSVLLALTKRLRAAGGDLTIRNTPAMIRKTFEIAGVHELLTIEPPADGAGAGAFS